MAFGRGTVGRPGLAGTVARTAVLAGTANEVNRRAEQRAALTDTEVAAAKARLLG
ncbi:hypothetical protein [Nocardia sp. NPDC056100]|uniref:hypothetical protein n=1 Tax=Nocardia sp. NPDC056100 TaxID=3345712 RepID=UPI0035DFD725